MAGRCNSCGAYSLEEILDAVIRELPCPGQGLQADLALRCLRVRLEPGGGIEFGPLGGLRVNCCDNVEPIPGACVSTIDSLGDFIIGGRGGGSSLRHPYGSPQGIQYGLDHALDMIVTGTWATTDEVAVWEVYSPSTPLNVYSQSPAAVSGASLSSSDWLSQIVDAGTAANPTGRNAYAPPGFLTPDGGWYGWYAPQYSPMTLSGALRLITQRAVVWADIANTPDGNAASRNVIAAIRAVSTACSYASTILAVNYDMAAYVESIENAQVTPAIYLDASQDSVTAAQVAATGVEWVRLSGSWSDALISPFVSAGLNVILVTDSRHVSTIRAQDLGVRGIHANLPVYARGGVDSALQYYVEPSVSYATRTTPGILTARTDTLGVVDARGYSKITEPGWGTWVTAERPRNSALITDVCPVPSPEEDSYTFRLQLDQGSYPAGGAPKIGVTFGQTTDVDTSPDPGQHDGYAAFIRVGSAQNGELEIGRFDPGTGYTMLAESTMSQPVAVNDYMNFRLEITPTGITFTRTDGTPYSVTVTDGDWRGPYVSWFANTADGQGEFASMFDAFVVASTSMAGAVPLPPEVPEGERPLLRNAVEGPY